MIHRTGISLIEVLVAIFITAVGMLALLTLFPLGALRMSDAIKDGRCAQAGANATASALAMNLRNDTNVLNAFTSASGSLASATVNGQPYQGPSYPVYVDPLGKASGTTLGQPQIQRVSPGYASSINSAYQWFSILDDITFGPNGMAAPGSTLTRTNRYSWAYMLQRPNYAVPSVVTMSVVVYSSRGSSGSTETPYSGLTLTQGSKIVTNFPAGAQIRRGSWLLDATVTSSSGPDPHGNFYRVVDITSTSSGSVTVELQTPLRQGSSSGTMIAMDAVAEVFDKGTGWRP